MTQRNAPRRAKKSRRRQIAGQLRQLRARTTRSALRARAEAPAASPPSDGA
jgi:hypothetical protein